MWHTSQYQEEPVITYGMELQRLLHLAKTSRDRTILRNLALHSDARISTEARSNPRCPEWAKLGKDDS